MHVCITMRSDYFGNCSAYAGLAEAVSASQFLIPLPLRGQMEEAIRRPVSRAGGAIEEALVQRLLVDVVEEVDQLPLLQHTLRRLWEKASGSPPTMREADYVADHHHSYAPRDDTRDEATYCHDIRDRVQRAVDRVLATPQILLTDGAE